MGKGIGGNDRFNGIQDVNGQLDLVSCDVKDVNSVLNSYFPGGVPTTADNYCQDTFYKSYVDYFDAQADVFSWTTCQSSFIDFTNAECRREYNFYFSVCSSPLISKTGLPNIDLAPTDVNGFLVTGSVNQDYFTCQMAWDQRYGGTAPTLPNFSTGGATFIADMWTDLMNTYQKEKWYPYTFCSKATTAGQKDNFYFVFEQDCKDDPKNLDGKTITHDWFVIKIKTSEMDGTVTSPIVQNAAYFGDRTGDEIPTSVQVDEYGYVTIHGNSDATVFGGKSTAISEQVWLYAKTHWELQYEMKVLSATFTPQFPFLSKRFIKPKVFKNGQVSGLTFLYVYTPFSTGSISFYLPRPINKPINGIPYEQLPIIFTPVYQMISGWITDNSVSVVLFGQAQFTLNDQFNYKVQRGIRFSLSTPVFCSSTLNVVSKDYATNIASLITGISATYTSLDDSSHLVFQGTVTASENTYYPYLWAFSNSMLSDTAQFNCPYVDFWTYQNNNQYPQMLRFQQSNMLRFIVDDRFQKPPEVKLNIPDFELLIGKRNNSESVLSTSLVYYPFQHTCSIYYAKQSRFLDSTYSVYSKNLPTWASFHEQNGTLTMYPDKVTGTTPISLEIYCCNSINECAVNNLLANVYDNDPEADFTRIPQTLTINVDGGVGECFTLAFNKQMIWDKDKVEDPTDIYKHQSHTIMVTKTSSNSGISQVSQIGMFFGQGYDTSSTNSNLGTNTVVYQYEDRYSSNKVYTDNELIVIVNQLPQISGPAKSLILQNLDLSTALSLPNSDYFDSFFPFLADEIPTSPAFNLSISTWFTDPDSSDPVSLSVTSSDGNPLPHYLLYDATKQTILSDDSNTTRPSEVVWIKVTAEDKNGGRATLRKPMLVNSIPRVRGAAWAVVTVGVGKKVLIKAIQEYFLDPDGDRLELTMRQKDEAELNSHGLVLESYIGTISGRAQFSGTLNMLQLKASDTHGAFAYFYLTIQIVDEKPVRRGRTIQLPDQTIYSGEPFYFSLSDELFYAKDLRPLILFAMDDLEQPLPDWLTFNPAYRAFSGTAPSKIGSIKVNLRMTEQKTHDSIPANFNIRIVRKSQPKQENVLGLQEIKIKTGESFDITIANQTLDLDWQNIDYRLTNAQDMEPAFNWIAFNQDNYTFTGRAPLTSGTYLFNLSGTHENKTIILVSLKLIVIPSNPSQLIVFWGLSAMTLGSMVIFLFSIFHLSCRYSKNSRLHERMEVSHKRFGHYKQIDLKYYQQENKVEKARAPGVFVQVDQLVSTTLNKRFEPPLRETGIVIIQNKRADKYKSAETPRK